MKIIHLNNAMAKFYREVGDIKGRKFDICQKKLKLIKPEWKLISISCKGDSIKGINVEDENSNKITIRNSQIIRENS